MTTETFAAVILDYEAAEPPASSGWTVGTIAF